MQNAFFGASPKNKLLKLIIEKCIENVKNKNYGRSFIDVTGPQLFGEMYNKVYDSNNLKDNILVGRWDIIGNLQFFTFGDKNFKIQHKCDSCDQTQHWENGNHYVQLWYDKQVFLT